MPSKLIKLKFQSNKITKVNTILNHYIITKILIAISNS